MLFQNFPKRMNAAWLLLAYLLCATASFGQLTLKVNSIPLNTPADANIHVAGTFNNWNPSDPTQILSALGNGQYSITVNPPAGQVKFKFTRGSWATVEGNANGGYLPDRTYNYNGQPTTLDLTILSWEDMGVGGAGTAEPNVFLLDDDFYMPQLNRTRRIWMYLPPDYQTSQKSYPVLYMHDGQNLFDENTSFSGEWEVDESLNELFTQGDYGCIVVGINNGEAYRLDEYSPWVNPQYGGGDGDLYVEFIVNTLKPYIDANYRTLTNRQSTGIMGSSMGGLISMYAFSERQDVFSRAGVFSPAFWFADNSPANHVAAHAKQGDARVYFLAGGEEPDYVEQDMTQVANAMLTAGFNPNEIYFEVPSDGTHSEWFWAREFPAAYVWLFQDAVSASMEAKATPSLQVYPNPARNKVRVADLPSNEKISYKIIGLDGKIWRDTSLNGNQPINVSELPSGFYLLKMKWGKGPWRTGKIVK